MDALDFDLNKTTSQAFYLLGNDVFFVKKILDIFKALIPEEEHILNVLIFDDINSNIKDIELHINNISLFGSTKVIIIQDLLNNVRKNVSTDLASLVKSLPDNTYIIFDNTMIDKRTDLYKQLEKIDCSFDKNKLALLSKILIEETSNRLELSAANLILQYCLYNLGKSIIEAKKILQFELNEKIGTDLVQLLVVDSTENKIYELTDAISKKDKARALSIVNNLFSLGIQPSYLIASLSTQYRRMLYTRITKKNDNELANDLGVNSYHIRGVRKIANSYSPLQLKNLVDKIVNTEYSFKSGIFADKTGFDSLFASLLAL